MSTRTERTALFRKGQTVRPFAMDCDCDRVLSVVKLSEVIAGIGIWDRELSGVHSNALQMPSCVET